MNGELLQSTIDVVFKGNMLYLTPFLFLMMVILFSDRLIDLVFNAMERKRNRY